MSDDQPTCQYPGCGSTVLVGGEYCWNHSPSISDEERLSARVKGGSASRNMLKARPEDVEKHLPDPTQAAALEAQRTAVASMLAMLEASPGDLKVATALSQACGRLSRQLAMHDLEERVLEIEKRLEIGRGKKAR